MHAYMHTCIHAYMHTCIHAYMHTCIHAYIHAYMHTCIHASMHPCIHASMHTYIHTDRFTDLCIRNISMVIWLLVLASGHQTWGWFSHTTKASAGAPALIPQEGLADAQSGRGLSLKRYVWYRKNKYLQQPRKRAPIWLWLPPQKWDLRVKMLRSVFLNYFLFFWFELD